MQNIKETIAKNLVELRKSRKMTQGTLAEMLNYSDKAISRWERGETLPDIETLCRVCEIYGVSFEYLLKSDSQVPPPHEEKHQNRARHVIMCLIAVSTVWLAATVAFFTVKTISSFTPWQIFVWAIPASIATIEIFNRIWWKRKVCDAITASFTTWTAILAIYLQLISHNFWLLFIIGVPIQIIILLAITMPEKKD